MVGPSYERQWRERSGARSEGGRGGLGAALAILIVVTAACSEQDGPSRSFDEGGALTMNIFEPTSIDPVKISETGEDYLVLMVYEPLLTYDPRTMRPVPAAAQELPALSPDGLRYTLTLREGLAYSDGSPVRAKDFAYAWSRLCDPGLVAVGSPKSAVAYAIVGCEEWNRLDPVKTDPATLKAARDRLLTEGIVARSDRVIEFDLARRAPYFPSVLAMWLGVPVRQADILRGGETWTDPATYVGNGPYVLSEWTHGERMVFTANARYRTPPKVKRWTMLSGRPPDRSTPELSAAALGAYRDGRVDIHNLAATEFTGVSNDPAFSADLVVHGNNCFSAVRFNVTRPPFDDPKVRLALAKSFDRAARLRETGGRGTAALSIIPVGMPGHDAADTAQAFDPVAARALLAASAYASSPALSRISFVVTDTAALSAARWFRDQWLTNLGVDVVPQLVDDATWTDLKRRLQTRPPLTYLTFCPSNADQYGYLTRIAESRSDGPLARWGYASAEFDGLVHRAEAELDARTREELYAQASRLLSRDAPAAFTSYDVNAYLRKPWVRGITDSPLDTYPGMFDLLSIYVTRH